MKKLYFDMEWVPIAKDYQSLEEKFPNHAEAWSRRCEKWRGNGKHNDLSDADIYDLEAGFYPEFIQIICISVGYYKDGELAIQSFYGDIEKEILERVHELFTKTAGKYTLCGHSIKRFDMPYLAKRMAINGLTIPWDLNNGAKKPWEINSIDIAEEWGFGCNAEKYTPLDWMCISLGVPTSKTDISGKDVKLAYYNDNRLEDIKNYCEADVKATAEVEQKIFSLTNPSLVS
jgi:3'-5' exonuclease